jgi:hypothetical protein
MCTLYSNRIERAFAASKRCSRVIASNLISPHPSPDCICVGARTTSIIHAKLSSSARSRAGGATCVCDSPQDVSCTTLSCDGLLTGSACDRFSATRKIAVAELQSSCGDSLLCSPPSRLYA